MSTRRSRRRSRHLGKEGSSESDSPGDSLEPNQESTPSSILEDPVLSDPASPPPGHQFDTKPALSTVQSESHLDGLRHRFSSANRNLPNGERQARSMSPRRNSILGELGFQPKMPEFMEPRVKKIMESKQFKQLSKTLDYSTLCLKDALKNFQGDMKDVFEVLKEHTLENIQQLSERANLLRTLNQDSLTTDHLDLLDRLEMYQFDPKAPRSTLPWRRRMTVDGLQKDLRFFAYVDPLLKLYAQEGKEKGTPVPVDRSRDSTAFVVGVCDVILTSILVTNYPNMFCFYHVTRFLILLWLRIFEFYERHWGWCLIEVCYYINALLLRYIIGRGHWSPDTLKPIFLLCNGPVLWGLIIFQNSLVFHSITKYTSMVLHFSPALVTWALRWKISPPAKNAVVFPDWPTFLSGFSDALWHFSAHQLFWWIACGVLFRRYIRDDPKASNCFTSLTESKSGLFYKAIDTFGDRFQEFLFCCFYTFGAGLSMFPALLFWRSVWAHTIFMITALVIAIWNAGDFYVQRDQLTLQLAKEKFGG